MPSVRLIALDEPAEHHEEEGDEQRQRHGGDQGLLPEGHQSCFVLTLV
jgi:hypothetical protein